MGSILHKKYFRHAQATIFVLLCVQVGYPGGIFAPFIPGTAPRHILTSNLPLGKDLDYLFHCSLRD
jgi:hypothetical protein